MPLRYFKISNKQDHTSLYAATDRAILIEFHTVLLPGARRTYGATSRADLTTLQEISAGEIDDLLSDSIDKKVWELFKKNGSQMPVFSIAVLH